MNYFDDDHRFKDPKAAADEDLTFKFTGTAGEYFKIWIVNIAFTILTLGIYAPWAKVRREQYLLGHTYLGATSFDYNANPWSILKGRFVVFASLAIYSLAYNFFPLAGIILTILLSFFIPWVVTQSLKFKTRYISYRNIPFGFAGNSSGVFTNFMLLKVLGYFTLGILVPWCKYKEKAYLVDNIRYGMSKFKFNSTVGQFYKSYIITAILSVPLILAISFTIVLIRTAIPAGNDAIQKSLSTGLVAIVALGLFIIVPYLLKVMLVKATWNNTTIENRTIHFNASVLKYFGIVFSNLLLRVVTLGLATPYCVIRMKKFLVDNFEITGHGSLDGFINDRKAELNSLGEQASELYDLDIDIGF